MRHARSFFVQTSTSHGFDAPAPLNRAERTALVVGIVGMLIVTVVMAVIDGELISFVTLLDIGLTALFAVFLVSPPLAVVLFAVAMSPSLLLGWVGPAFSALIVATGLVARTGSTRLMIIFTGLLLVTAAVITIRQPASAAAVIGIGLLIAVVAGAVGILLRTVRGREQRLDVVLEEQAAIMAQLRRDERLLIADELHDVVAHDLTAIAMQARVMDHQHDPVLRAETQREIGDSARRALRDIRRLIAPGHGETSTARIDDFEITLSEMVTTLRNAGYSPETVTDFDHAMPRLVGGTLSRILRESTTNILKHGKTGSVNISAGADARTAWLQVTNTFRARRDQSRIPSGGFGSVRLAERVGLLGGEFSQSVNGDEWVLRASLPLL